MKEERFCLRVFAATNEDSASSSSMLSVSSSSAGKGVGSWVFSALL
jgi:hypothetical protein